jgi:putative phage-type endonuclease
MAEEEEMDLIESIIELIHDYIDTHPTEPSEPEFHETMMESLTDILEIQFEDFLNKNKMTHFFFFSNEVGLDASSNELQKDAEEYEEWLERLDEAIHIAVELYYHTIMPRRSYPDTRILHKKTQAEFQQIAQRIFYLKNKPQPKQRTDEWYETRYNLLTASNAYKAFESQSMKNQLIYEKCQPICNSKNNTSFTNVNTTFHWGQKYEPLSTMFYERLYNTTIGEFGCIQHDKYLFIGASPDGINVDPASPRYGRLLEIKNIVNREIDGIPKKEYWIQMQLQMETCGLDECDFLEMRFTEYRDDEDKEKYSSLFLTAEKKFLMDGDTFDKTAKDEYKGVIMYFTKEDGNPHYEYMPFHVNTYEKFVKWEIGILARMEEEKRTWVQNLYWKLEEYSCVLVERNRLWFDKNVDDLESIWDTIVKERVSGCEHRSPAKRSSKTRSNSFVEPLGQNKCFLNVNKETGKVTILE